MPALATVCGQNATPNPAYGCGAILDAGNRSKHSSGLCRACDTVKRRMQRQARKSGQAPASAPSPSPAPVKPSQPAAPAADGCACRPGECLIRGNPARASLALIWDCRLAAERVATLQRFTQAQRQSLQVERESREMDGGYLDIEETKGQWDIAEQRLAKLFQTQQTILPPEWFELLEPGWLEFNTFWNAVSPVTANRNMGLPGDARPVYRGKDD